MRHFSVTSLTIHYQLNAETVQTQKQLFPCPGGKTWKVVLADGAGNNVWEPGQYGWAEV